MYNDELEFQCQYCGNYNAVEMDFSEGDMVEYEEECSVCARPNLIKIEKDDLHHTYHLEVHSEID